MSDSAFPDIAPDHEEIRRSRRIRHGDYLVDEGTGEILGLARDAIDLETFGQVEPVDTVSTFTVRDRDSAEWVLEKLLEAETDLAAIEARRRILNDNLDKMSAEPARRVEWLRMRFGADLERWARSEIADAKTRTVRTPFGTLSFRRTKRRVVVRDEDAAIAWAERSPYGSAVKTTKKLLISELPPANLIPAFDLEPDRFRELTGLDVDPGGDVFTIKTGA